MKQNRAKIIGLTGNLGSGKSSVTKILEKYNIPVFDCDKISHMEMQSGTECYKEIVDFFGDGILDNDGNIMRKTLGEIVFSDKAKLKKLNEITHYYICKTVVNGVNEIISSGYKYIVIDAPVLIGSELENFVDEIWVVYSDFETMLSRVSQRDNIQIEQIKKRLENQLSTEELKSRADFLIENNGSIEELEEKIKNLINK